VHVNQFTPQSLIQALERAGFSDAGVKAAAPELPPAGGARGLAGRGVRLGLFAAASLPGAIHTPLALHLQAFATKSR